MTNFFKSIPIVALIGYLFVILLAIYGWISNLLKLIGMIGSDFSTVAVEMIIRLVGIPVAPLGAIAGFF